MIDAPSLDRQFDKRKKSISINRFTEHAGLAQNRNLLLRFSQMSGNEQDRYLPFLPHDLHEFEAVQSRHLVIGNDQSIGAGLQSD